MTSVQLSRPFLAPFGVGARSEANHRRHGGFKGFGITGELWD
jgi:hypothetical protein